MWPPSDMLWVSRGCPKVPGPVGGGLGIPDHGGTTLSLETMGNGEQVTSWWSDLHHPCTATSAEGRCSQERATNTSSHQLHLKTQLPTHVGAPTLADVSALRVSGGQTAPFSYTPAAVQSRPGCDGAAHPVLSSVSVLYLFGLNSVPPGPVCGGPNPLDLQA